ncbi:MAG TPA: HD domain-containing phosphohydrolase [Deinococcales bacterium]|nr:HD domain-containing phosphohydrolase [Deinococcales bacterium]
MFRRRTQESPEPLDWSRAAAELFAARSVKGLLDSALAQALLLAPAASKAWMVLRSGTDRVAAVKGYGPEFLGLELVGPWMDGAARISTNVAGDLFQPNLPEVRARLAAAGLREVRSQLVVPLRERGDVHGAFVLDAYGAEPFSPLALEAVTRWANLALPALTLVSELSRYRTLSWGLTLAFVEAIESRDFAQLGHAQRVTSYAMALGRELNLTKPEMTDLWFAAMLHDLGKLAQDQLASEDEMAEHAKLGFNLLATVPELEAARQGILHHHERFDGTGQPDGLRGSSIPLFSRLIAVANAYDHLTSERGELLPPKQAGARLREMAAVELDPALVPVLEGIISQAKATGELRPEGLFPST